MVRQSLLRTKRIDNIVKEFAEQHDTQQAAICAERLDIAHSG